MFLGPVRAFEMALHAAREPPLFVGTTRRLSLRFLSSVVLSGGKIDIIGLLRRDSRVPRFALAIFF